MFDHEGVITMKNFHLSFCMSTLKSCLLAPKRPKISGHASILKGLETYGFEEPSMHDSN